MFDFRPFGSKVGHTIQPYFVFSTHSAYHKKIVRNSPISHFYGFIADNSDGEALAVPDASIDILFLCDIYQPEVRICGSVLNAKYVELQHNKRYFGVRFKPGFMPGFINLTPKELVNEEFALQDICHHATSLLEEITKESCFNQQTKIFMSHYGRRLYRETSLVCQHINKLILMNDGDIKVGELEKETGYSLRYINKLFTENFGLSPKSYCLMLKFQSSLNQLIKQQSLLLTHLAQDQGYADQSHFIRHFKKYAALTPKNFVKELQASDYQKRITLLDYTNSERGHRRI